MALINCDECGSLISDKAIVCPKCGNPNIEKTQNVSEKNKLLNNKVIIAICVVVTLILIVCVLVFVNYRSPLEKIINDDYQILKKEVSDDIILKDALYFKRTSNEGKEWFQVLIVYKYEGRTCYAGFNDEGEYLGDGDEYVNEANPDMDVAFNNFIVSIMIIEYDQYKSGSKSLMFSETEFEPVVEEDELNEYEQCVVPVSLKKIK